jgi:hypothetical protein
MIKNCPVINISPQLPNPAGRALAIDMQAESPENLGSKRRLQMPPES